MCQYTLGSELQQPHSHSLYSLNFITWLGHVVFMCPVTILPVSGAILKVVAVTQRWHILLNLSSSWGFSGLLLQMFSIGGSMVTDLLNLRPWGRLPGMIEGVHCEVTGSRSFTWAVNAEWTGSLPQMENSCELRLDLAGTEVQGLHWVILWRTQT